MARAGVASRRDAERMIEAGRVALNGALVSHPATMVGAQDFLAVDGKSIAVAERTRIWRYHKPAGLVTTARDPEGRPTVFATLPKILPRVASVGRLDINTEGLLLLTNDGALARILELPATGWLRRYRVRAHGSVTQAKLDELRGGVDIDGIHYGSVEATLDRIQGSNLWLTFAIREGKNREVRILLGHLGLTVARLIRVSFGPFQLGELAEGAVAEVPTRVLREQLGEKLAKVAGADFSAPIVQRKPEPAKASGRHPEERAPEGREPRRATAKDAPPSFEGRKQRPPQDDAKKKFQRPRRGEGARPSFDDRAPKRGGHPKRGRR